MQSDISNPVSRRSLLGLPDEAPGHISSLIVRCRPENLDTVAACIARLRIAEVAMAATSGKIVVTLETRDEDEIVGAMGAMERMRGVVSVALVFHQTDA